MIAARRLWKPACAIIIFSRRDRDIIPQFFRTCAEARYSAYNSRRSSQSGVARLRLLCISSISIPWPQRIRNPNNQLARRIESRRNFMGPTRVSIKRCSIAFAGPKTIQRDPELISLADPAVKAAVASAQKVLIDSCGWICGVIDLSTPSGRRDARQLSEGTK